jgi:hypothetical protein
LRHGRALEPSAAIWQNAAMASQTPRAGGCLMAASILAGAILGAWLGEPSKGIIAGAVAAALLGLLFWASERTRR